MRRLYPRRMQAHAIFLDLDGVLLDPVRTPAEWVRLVGDVLAPALGGEPADWGRANAEAFPRVFADRDRWVHDDPETAERRLVTHQLREQCRLVDVPDPGDDRAVSLGRELDHHVCRHADCAFPATGGVIRELAAAGPVHTATGNPSWRVETLLEQWGVRELVGVPAGVDLVKAMKHTDAFYGRVFALARVRADQAVVVDDAPEHLARVRSLGARTVHVDPAGSLSSAAADAVIANIAQLPAALGRIT